MSSQLSSGFHPGRNNRLLRVYEHDAYQSGEKPPDPTVCPECGAVFHDGRWQWCKIPLDAHRQICPSCHRINDHFPAGFLSLQGNFFREHHDEIMELVRNEEKHIRSEHPLKRIMAVEEQDGMALITTTDIHLAKDIGEALHHAYQGDLKLNYNPDENMLRASWTH